jgi:hypothetical protein
MADAFREKVFKKRNKQECTDSIEGKRQDEGNPLSVHPLGHVRGISSYGLDGLQNMGLRGKIVVRYAQS